MKATTNLFVKDICVNVTTPETFEVQNNHLLCKLIDQVVISILSMEFDGVSKLLRVTWFPYCMPIQAASLTL